MRYSSWPELRSRLSSRSGAGPARAQEAPPPPRPDAVVTEEAGAEAGVEDALLTDEELDELVGPGRALPGLAADPGARRLDRPARRGQGRPLRHRREGPLRQGPRRQGRGPGLGPERRRCWPAASRPSCRRWRPRSTGPRSSATRCWRRPTTCSTRCSASAPGRRRWATSRPTRPRSSSRPRTASPSPPPSRTWSMCRSTTRPRPTRRPTRRPAVIDTGISTSDVLTTGAIAFGSALLVNEIFDDDDDWDDYWDDGPDIDWDEATSMPGPASTSTAT